MHYLSQLLSLHAFAIAFCKGAHLASVKLYVRAFLKLAGTKFSADSGLRAANASEMQYADKAAWTQIAVLFNEKNWSLDDAIYEIVEVRSALSSLLQPRPFVPKVFAEGKGKGKGNGKPNRKGDPGESPPLPMTPRGKGQQRQVTPLYIDFGTLY